MKIPRTFTATAAALGLFAGAAFAADLSASGTVISVDAATNEVVIRGESGAESTMRLDAQTIARLKPGMTIKASLEE